MLFVNFLIEKTLTCRHLHVNLNLIQLTEEVFQLILEVLDDVGAHDGPEALDLAERLDITKNSVHRAHQVIHSLWVHTADKLCQVSHSARHGI